MFIICYANIGHERPHYDRVVAAAYFKTTQNSYFFLQKSITRNKTKLILHRSLKHSTTFSPSASSVPTY